MCVRAEYFPEYLARVIKPVFLECVQTSSPRLSVKQTSWDNNERSEFSARNVPRQKTLDKDAGDSLHALPCVYCLGFIRWPFVFGLWPLSHVALSQWKQTYSKSANSARKKLMSLMWNGKKKRQASTGQQVLPIKMAQQPFRWHGTSNICDARFHMRNALFGKQKVLSLIVLGIITGFSNCFSWQPFHKHLPHLYHCIESNMSGDHRSFDIYPIKQLKIRPPKQTQTQLVSWDSRHKTAIFSPFHIVSWSHLWEIQLR